MEDIGLVELIDRLKQDLVQTHRGDVPLFAITNVEITISFTATRSKNGGIDLKVISAGADRSREQVQQITVNLESLISIDELRAQLPDKMKPAIVRKIVRGEEE